MCFYSILSLNPQDKPRVGPKSLVLELNSVLWNLNSLSVLMYPVPHRYVSEGWGLHFQYKVLQKFHEEFPSREIAPVQGGAKVLCRKQRQVDEISM